MRQANLTYVQEAFIDGGSLVCPSCNNTNLHQLNVTVYERGEDDSYTTVIAQNKHEVYASKFKSEDTCNPSSRRNGLLLEFMCEHCHESDSEKGWSTEKPFLLGISQHKGDTLMQWFK
jgi:hypothetical protein